MTEKGRFKPAPSRSDVQLPKRFYKATSVASTPDGFAVQLDGRPVRTPSKRPLAVPSAELAAALADEWERQQDVIDPATMPLTRILNSAIDGVQGREDEVRDEIAKYASSDLLCYRADHPEALVALQSAAWDPVLDWAKNQYGVSLRVTTGLMPVPQEAAEIARLRAALASEGTLVVTALHVMTTLTGSALLALAHRHGALDADGAWSAAHVDEDWQISQWGEDAEAARRQAHRKKEFLSASQVMQAGLGA